MNYKYYLSIYYPCKYNAQSSTLIRLLNIVYYVFQLLIFYPFKMILPFKEKSIVLTLHFAFTLLSKIKPT